MNEQILIQFKNFCNQKLKVILKKILIYFTDSLIAKDQCACLNEIPELAEKKTNYRIETQRLN